MVTEYHETTKKRELPKTKANKTEALSRANGKILLHIYILDGGTENTGRTYEGKILGSSNTIAIPPHYLHCLKEEGKPCTARWDGLDRCSAPYLVLNDSFFLDLASIRCD